MSRRSQIRPLNVLCGTQTPNSSWLS